MTKSSRKNSPEAGIDLGTACIPSGIATEQKLPHINGKVVWRVLLSMDYEYTFGINNALCLLSIIWYIHT